MRLSQTAVFFLLGFAVSAAPAQEAVSDSCTGEIGTDTTYIVTVNPGLPRYHVHFLVREDCANVTVLVEGRKDTLQQFIAHWESYILNDGIGFVDANFDGYLDLQVFYDRGNSGNESFNFYLFDKKTGRFTYDENFSGLFGQGASFDPDKKEIRTGGLRGCAGDCYAFETYRQVNGKMILVSVLRQEDAGQRADGQLLFVRTLQELEDGQMKVIQKVKGTLEQIDKKWKD